MISWGPFLSRPLCFIAEHKNIIGRTPKLRRVLERFWGRVLRRVLRSGPAMGFTVEKGSEKGSQKVF